MKMSKKKQGGSTDLEKLWNSLTDIDKLRVSLYIYREIQLPLMIDNLKKCGLLSEDFKLK